MANHKSAFKRIRQSNVKRLHNRYYAKTARNAVKKLRETEEKNEAQALFPKVCSLLDKLAKKNIIHKNKAANLKSKLAKHVNALA
ncbi:MAG: 30S ribosomal protein S20 [Tannerellaceae bacterium]|jgi:small subunit ribosomal protein S20|nr:30S ribosomal protein S20 [Tannerellaceae bacterium]